MASRIRTDEWRAGLADEASALRKLWATVALHRGRGVMASRIRTDEQRAGLADEAAKARKLWATVVLHAINDAAHEIRKARETPAKNYRRAMADIAGLELEAAVKERAESDALSRFKLETDRSERRVEDHKNTFLRWLKSRDGHTVLRCAGIDPCERVFDALINQIMTGTSASYISHSAAAGKKKIKEGGAR